MFEIKAFPATSALEICIVMKRSACELISLRFHSEKIGTERASVAGLCRLFGVGIRTYVLYTHKSSTRTDRGHTLTTSEHSLHVFSSFAKKVKTEVRNC